MVVSIHNTWRITSFIKWSDLGPSRRPHVKSSTVEAHSPSTAVAEVLAAVKTLVPRQSMIGCTSRPSVIVDGLTGQSIHPTSDADPWPLNCSLWAGMRGGKAREHREMPPPSRYSSGAATDGQNPHPRYQVREQLSTASFLPPLPIKTLSRVSAPLCREKQKLEL